jgi:hypothetical protein
MRPREVAVTGEREVAVVVSFFVRRLLLRIGGRWAISIIAVVPTLFEVATWLW